MVQLWLRRDRSRALQLQWDEKTAGDEIEAKKIKYPRNFSHRVPP
jgi:hypothetical protein